MSHFLNLANMGYVPTPPLVVERVATMLEAQEGLSYFLDPCCGKGEALAQLKELLGVGQTFGVELDVSRSEVAATVLDEVLESSYEQVFVSKGDNGAELLWLNPPYSTDTKAGRRLELTFLRETQDWLCPDGILVYIIRQPHLTGNVARRLSTWFDHISIYRFPKEEFEIYQQVVVFGVKKARASKDDEAKLYVLQCAAEHITELPEVPDRTYMIPIREHAAWRFRSKQVSPLEIQEEALTQGVLQSRWWREYQEPALQQDRQPLMPLRLGHLALFLAAGLLNNVELQKGEEHLLIKGHTFKVQKDVSTEEEKKNNVQRTIEEFRTTIQILDLSTGETQTLNNPKLLTEFVDQWQKTLSQAVVDAYPPIHDLTITDEEQAILDPLLQHKRLPGRRGTGLLPVQAQVAVAGAKAIQLRKSISLIMATGTGKTCVSLGIAQLLQHARSKNGK